MPGSARFLVDWLPAEEYPVDIRFVLNKRTGPAALYDQTEISSSLSNDLDHLRTAAQAPDGVIHAGHRPHALGT